MRPRPFFQSLPVFTCFDCGLRFFVSKLCPNSILLSGHTRHWQQPSLDEFERAEQIAIDRSHVFVCEHLVECPPCVGAPVWFDADIEFEMVEVIEFAFVLPVIDVDDVMIVDVLVLIIGVGVDGVETERVDVVADRVVMLRAWFMTVDYEAAGGVPC